MFSIQKIKICDTKLIKLFIGQRGYNYSYTKEFRQLDNFGNGTYLVDLYIHFATIKNGVIYDIFDSRTESKYTNQSFASWDLKL